MGVVRAVIVDEKMWWYVARSSGIVAMVLLVASLIWGVLLATRVLKSAGRPAWLLDVHRFVSGMAIAVTVLHMFGLMMDGYVQFGLAELLVPGRSPYRPAGVALGVVAFYMLGAVEVTSLLRRRMSARAWRAVHMTSYVLVLFAALHAGMSGTDTSNWVYQLAAVTLIVLAVSAGVVRAVAGSKRHPVR